MNSLLTAGHFAGKRGSAWAPRNSCRRGRADWQAGDSGHNATNAINCAPAMRAAPAVLRRRRRVPTAAPPESRAETATSVDLAAEPVACCPITARQRQHQKGTSRMKYRTRPRCGGPRISAAAGIAARLPVQSINPQPARCWHAVKIGRPATVGWWRPLSLAHLTGQQRLLTGSSPPEP